VNTNISHIKSCYGCGVCAVICPQQIIKIALNKNGFYEPYIVEEGKCTDCGLCLSVCSYTDEQLSVEYASEIQGFAAWSNDENIRRLCSSGGIGFEIGKYLIKQGYKACGVQYNPGMNRADHFMASSTEEFVPSIGSKYIQSYTIDAFRQINRKDKYFITGTPCQIDSMRRYIRKMKIEENFVLMDFFCHGVPSMHVWKKYTKQAEKIVGKIIYASWRNKQTVWHDSWNMEEIGRASCRERVFLSV
jgi:coenzyme F420-reducing hydrogenase beta subunit